MYALRALALPLGQAMHARRGLPEADPGLSTAQAHLENPNVKRILIVLIVQAEQR